MNTAIGSLTLRERLVLYLQVLGAVQYAHTHLVIHRRPEAIEHPLHQ
jgi:hypothetical protein